MKLLLKRFMTTDKATMGTLSIDGKHQCYTLEDPHNEPKIYGKTRIPQGVYQLKLRTFGGFHQRYSAKFTPDHRGMIEICDVPNFEHVLMHIGNYPRDTEGCVLVGVLAGVNRLQSSTDAYKPFYNKASYVLGKGKEVTLEIIDC